MGDQSVQQFEFKRDKQLDLTINSESYSNIIFYELISKSIKDFTGHH